MDLNKKMVNALNESLVEIAVQLVRYQTINECIITLRKQGVCEEHLSTVKASADCCIHDALSIIKSLHVPCDFWEPIAQTESRTYAIMMGARSA